MSGERIRRLEEIYHDALDLPPDQRPGYLDRACADDPELRGEVESLLQHAEGPSLDGVLERPPVRLGEPGRHVTDPDEIGPYRILERSGEGGFGLVYVAQQLHPIRRRVAIKVLKAGMDTEAVLARFEAERQALALMDHPNIARVLDAGATDAGRPYFVMELVKGESLIEYCDRHRLPLRERLELFVPVCLAVQHAHQRGIIHRDLKPANILVTLVDGHPVPKIIDFGIAKATAAALTERPLHTVQGQLMGTPAYMSPEQAERTGLDVDTTTDVYSLGAILYELLCGKPPIHEEKLKEAGLENLARLLRDYEPRSPSRRCSRVTEQLIRIARDRHVQPWQLAKQLRGELDWIALRAIEKDRTQRYQTALELAEEIRRHLEDEEVHASPPGMRYRARKFVRRHRAGLAVVGAVAFGLVLAAGALTWSLVESNRQREQARRAQAEAEAVTGFLTDMLTQASPIRQGRQVTVKEVMDQTAPLVTERFAEQPLVKARIAHTMGVVYRGLGDYEHARHHARTAWKLRSEELGPHDRHALEAKREWGRVEAAAGNLDRADSLLTQVLAERRATNGPESRPTLESIYDLASLRLWQQRDPEAATMMEEALPVARRVLEPDDDLLGVMLSNLGVAYSSVGDYDRAEPILREVLEREREQWGPRHVETLPALQNLASLYRETGRYEDALPLYLESVEGAREVYGTENAETLRFENNLALLYSDMERYDDALPLSRNVLETRRRLLGPDNPSTLVSAINLALLHLRMESWDECRELAEDTHRRLLETVGDTHLYTLSLEGILASALIQRGEAERALEMSRSTVERSRELFPPDHWRLGQCLVRLGDALLANRRFEEGEVVGREAYGVLEKALGADHDRTLDAARLLAEVYEGWGRPAEAERWRQVERGHDS